MKGSVKTRHLTLNININNSHPNRRENLLIISNTEKAQGRVTPFYQVGSVTLPRKEGVCETRENIAVLRGEKHHHPACAHGDV